jgi:brefeldin A-resistance guanine nucleotide exchange factor 1
MKRHLKLQFELFFTTILTQILDSNSSYNTKKIATNNNSGLSPLLLSRQEIALEILVELCSEPSFVTELYINYDCDLMSANIFEQLCKYLYKVHLIGSSYY